jgi:RNA polymerase sigma-70 factor (ECF subfamily)
MTPDKDLQLARYIALAKEGKQHAYNFLLNTYWNDIYRFLLAKTQNENEAEDLAIKSFSKAFEFLDQYKEKFSFKSWLLTIARNLFIDEVRRKKTHLISFDKNKEEIYELFDESPSPEDLLINEQNLARLKSLIKQLKPHYAQMINLRYFQELTYKEIALEIGEPLNNVKVKILRARKLLAELIQK